MTNCFITNYMKYELTFMRERWRQRRSASPRCCLIFSFAVRSRTKNTDTGGVIHECTVWEWTVSLLFLRCKRWCSLGLSRGTEHGNEREEKKKEQTRLLSVDGQAVMCSIYTFVCVPWCYILGYYYRYRLKPGAAVPTSSASRLWVM